MYVESTILYVQFDMLNSTSTVKFPKNSVFIAKHVQYCGYSICLVKHVHYGMRNISCTVQCVQISIVYECFTVLCVLYSCLPTTMHCTSYQILQTVYQTYCLLDILYDTYQYIVHAILRSCVLYISGLKFFAVLYYNVLAVYTQRYSKPYGSTLHSIVYKTQYTIQTILRVLCHDALLDKLCCTYCISHNCMSSLYYIP